MKKYSILKKMLKNKVQMLGLEKQIIILDWLNPDEINYALANSDLLVFPSLVESFGLPLVEAMANGCPIIAADLPYAHDVLADAGIYFNPYESNELAKCALNVLTHTDLAKKLRELGKKRSNIFNYKNISEQIANVIELVSFRKNGYVN